jgi:hypothetical protein
MECVYLPTYLWFVNNCTKIACSDIYTSDYQSSFTCYNINIVEKGVLVDCIFAITQLWEKQREYNLIYLWFTDQKEDFDTVKPQWITQYNAQEGYFPIFGESNKKPILGNQAMIQTEV